MKTLLSTTKPHYTIRIGMVFIAATLIAAMISCTTVRYDLKTSSSEGGSVTTPGEGTFNYEDGAVANLVATPDAGYHFANWTGDVDTIVNVEAAETTITMNGDYEITANFGKGYELTVSSSEGGSVTTPGEGVFTYAADMMVSLVASPTDGYRFLNWTGDVDTIADVNAASTTITMDDNYSITASFVAQYVLTIDATEGGEVAAPGEGTFTYDAGAVLDLVAEAEEGYQFVTWTGDVAAIADIDAPVTTISMNGNYAVTANFEEVEEHQIVTFNDPNLEAAIREAIDKPHGPVYAQEMEGLTSLSAQDSSISDLTGLEYAVGLQSLDLCCNDIVDVSPLTGLTHLMDLDLDTNHIANISPLSSLTSLTNLSLNGNEITDVSPLLQNEGLGEGDIIYLQGDPLSWHSVHVYIPELQARGATVIYDEEGIPGEVIVEPPCEMIIAEYTITFEIAADLHSGTQSITIRFPEETTVPQTDWQTGYITVNGHDVFGLEVTVVGTRVTFLVPRYVASGTVTVVFKEDAGIVNPPAGWYYIYVNTSRAPDSTPRRIGPY